jgi:hypothetical protein
MGIGAGMVMLAGTIAHLKQRRARADHGDGYGQTYRY